MADALQLIEFSQSSSTSSGKSIPSILNRKRKIPPKTVMVENQENTLNTHVFNEKHTNVYAISESPMRSRSPLHPIEFNFPHRQNVASGASKIESGLRLKDDWKKFRDFNDKTDEEERISKQKT